MKKVLLFLALVMALAVGKLPAAMSYANVTMNATASGQLFALLSATAPLTYSATTVAGPGIIINRLVFAPNTVTYTAQTTVQLWDTANGLTYSAGSRPMTPPINYLLATQDKPFVWDFQQANGADYSYGAFCKGFPVLLETGTNTVNAQIQYVKGPGNIVLPGTSAGVVPH